MASAATRHENDIAIPIQDLRARFDIQRPAEVIAYLNRNLEFFGLLLEIEAELKRYFGCESVPQLEVSSDGDEEPSLKAVIPWRGPLLKAKAALEEFDNHYWLANCGRASGKIIVDYELV